MHEINQMWKIEKSRIQSHTIHNNTNIFSRKLLHEKTQLKGEVSLLSFLWYKNNANTKEKALSMELPETCGMFDCYKTLTSYVMLSNFPLSFFQLCYGTKYNNIEWNPFSS
jgi:hypothetical protein